MKKQQTCNETPHDIALAGLWYLVASPWQMAKFFTKTGLRATDLARVAEENEFLVEILNFIAEDEVRLQEFSCHAKLPLAVIAEAMMILNSKLDS